MGRHSDGTSARPWWVKPLVTFVLGAFLFGSGLVVISGASLFPQGTPQPGSSERNCESVMTLSLTVAPALYQAVDAAVQEAGRRSCTHFDVNKQESWETAAELAAGEGPQLWIPDASLWAHQVARHRPGMLAGGHSLAVSPVLVAAGSNRSVNASNWTELVQQNWGLQLSDPQRYTAARLAVSAAADEIAPEAVARGRFNMALVGLHHRRAESLEAQLEALRDPDAAAFAVDEATLARHLWSSPSTRLNVSVPASGTARLDFPLWWRSSEAEQVSEAVAALRQALDSTSGRAAIQAAGLRLGTTDIAAPRGITLPSTPTYRASTPPDVINRTMTAWSRAGVPARQLVLVDVSESMRTLAGRTTRLWLAINAARLALSGYPDDWAMGLWSFSQQGGQGSSAREALAPVTDLSQMAENTGQRALLDSRFTSLATRPAGVSTLYHAVLFGYAQAQQDWDPQRSNAVVILTDGRNTACGMTHQELIAKLRATRDPKRPIVVQLVGIGVDANSATGKELRDIADSVGGRTYYASDPNVLVSLFIDAALSTPRDVS